MERMNKIVNTSFDYRELKENVIRELNEILIKAESKFYVATNIALNHMPDEEEREYVVNACLDVYNEVFKLRESLLKEK